MTQRESRVVPSFVKALTVAGCVLAAGAICAHGRLLAAGNSDAKTVKPSPDYGLTVWAAEKGQPPGDVFAIAQDAEGYLWLGTPNGLYRFDGARFTPWNAISPATPLPNGPVHALIGAPDGSLWIGLGGGGGVVRVVRGQVTRYTPVEGAPPGVTGMIQDRQGAIWAAANRGLYRFLNDRWTLMGEPDGYNGAEAFSVYEDRSGSVWAGTAAGVYRRSKDRFELVDATSTNVQSLVEDTAGDVWLSDAAEIVKRLSTHAAPRHGRDIRLPAGSWRLMRDSRGQIWVAAFGGGLLRVRDPLAPAPVMDRFE
jgi:ligand-binding sensor domain-containing protein